MVPCGPNCAIVLVTEAIAWPTHWSPGAPAQCEGRGPCAGQSNFAHCSGVSVVRMAPDKKPTGRWRITEMIGERIYSGSPYEESRLWRAVVVDDWGSVRAPPGLIRNSEVLPDPDDVEAQCETAFATSSRAPNRLGAQRSRRLVRGWFETSQEEFERIIADHPQALRRRSDRPTCNRVCKARVHLRAHARRSRGDGEGPASQARARRRRPGHEHQQFTRIMREDCRSPALTGRAQLPRRARTFFRSTERFLHWRKLLQGSRAACCRRAA